jgi:hypothetical protein
MFLRGLIDDHVHIPGTEHLALSSWIAASLCYKIQNTLALW